MKQVKCIFSGHFLDNAWRNGVKFGIPMYHDHPQKWLDFYGLFTLKILAQFDLVEREKWVFLGIFLRTQGGNGLKFGMVIYRDRLQNWLNFGHSLLLIFAQETGQM